MAKSDKKQSKAAVDPNERPITENRKARHKFEVLDTLECGLALVGSEVKSLRNGKVSLDEAYVRVKDDEVWLIGCDIQEYTHAATMNHDPRRPRKLLLHRREIKKFAQSAYEKGLTLAPLKLYFKRGRAKLLVGLCRGLKKFDKREKLKEKTVKRDIDRAHKQRR